MEYPFWLIPGINKGLIIGVISVLHVFVAHFAVGGGLYLVWMEGKARKSRSPELLEWLERHTRFFLLLTMVFGGLSGVAIWFAMTVASPAATSFIIHNFLFIWAAEWTFFLVEVVVLMLYYYTYPLLRQGKFSPSLHLRIGWLYAFAGVMSLVTINAIISFMLTPGESPDTRNIIDAAFNPSFLPSLAFRFALCLLLAGMFALFTAARISSKEIKQMVVRSSSVFWICLPLLALLASSYWYYHALPPDRQAAIVRRTADIQPFVKAYGWILPAIFLAGVLAFARAERLRRPLAAVILCTGLVLIGSFEWIRETGRRPWVFPGIMYSNGVLVTEGERMNKEGMNALSGWARMLSNEETAKNALVSRGALIFDRQCGSCHAIDGPRLDVTPLLQRFSSVEGIKAQLAGQGKRLDYMPPFFGNADDADTLAHFLNAIRARR